MQGILEKKKQKGKEKDRSPLPRRNGPFRIRSMEGKGRTLPLGRNRRFRSSFALRKNQKGAKRREGKKKKLEAYHDATRYSPLSPLPPYPPIPLVRSVRGYVLPGRSQVRERHRPPVRGLRRRSYVRITTIIRSTTTTTTTTAK